MCSGSKNSGSLFHIRHGAGPVTVILKLYLITRRHDHLYRPLLKVFVISFEQEKAFFYHELQRILQTYFLKVYISCGPCTNKQIQYPVVCSSIYVRGRSHEMTWNLSKNYTGSIFQVKFYPKKRKLRQMPYHDKTAKILVGNKIITLGVFTLDNLTRVLLPR